jgi:hypothetical protein
VTPGKSVKLYGFVRSLLGMTLCSIPRGESSLDHSVVMLSLLGCVGEMNHNTLLESISVTSRDVELKSKATH